jgi:D-glycero-D-manno-heptose 1,7-bisphosphate phosphatase
MTVQSELRDGLGCWAEIRTPDVGRWRGKAALFLDRDGVIIEEKNYLARPDQVVLIGSAVETIAAANRAGIPVVIVTNQSGIAREYYGWPDFTAVMDRMHEKLAAGGAHIDLVYACGFHDSATGPLGVAGHAWRKPEAGMLLAAGEDAALDLSGSIIVGDKAADLAAGKAAGLHAGILVASGYGGDAKEQDAAGRLQSASFAVTTAPHLNPTSVLPLVGRKR